MLPLAILIVTSLLLASNRRFSFITKRTIVRTRLLCIMQ